MKLEDEGIQFLYSKFSFYVQKTGHYVVDSTYSKNTSVQQSFRQVRTINTCIFIFTANFHIFCHSEPVTNLNVLVIGAPFGLFSEQVYELNEQPDRIQTEQLHIELHNKFIQFKFVHLQDGREFLYI